ncbi:hypothetical protein [Corynebacterium sp.]|uniref:hypothetical protein n=1 Tax=Corynebacterium sp. TaxID=1720 RepID=UPI0028B17F99|nr:hypothetical protein [Corynebacterium sp.]
MTPEEARALEPGTTPGPWYAFRSDDPDDDMYEVLGTNPHRPNTHPILVDLILGPDAFLIAAAPDMRATIAAQTWEHGVEMDDVTSNPDPSNPGPRRRVQWCASEDYARTAVSAVFRQDRNPRLVRRLVGAVEVVDMEGSDT